MFVECWPRSEESTKDFLLSLLLWTLKKLRFLRVVFSGGGDQLLINVSKVSWNNYLKLINADVIFHMLASVTFLQQGNVKISKNLMKIVNIAEENLHIFWTSGEIPIKYSGHVSPMIILKIGTQLPLSHQPFKG